MKKLRVYVFVCICVKYKKKCVYNKLKQFLSTILFHVFSSVKTNQGRMCLN